MAYGDYRGQCVGRLLRFLYDYHSMLAETVIFHDDGKITDRHDNGDVIATYTWNNDGDGDIPTFEFTPKFGYLREVQARRQPEIIKYEDILGKEPYSKKAELAAEEKKKKEHWDKIHQEIMGWSE